MKNKIELPELGSPGSENMLAFIAMGNDLAIDLETDLKFAGLFLGVLAAQVPSKVWRESLASARNYYLQRGSQPGH